MVYAGVNVVTGEAVAIKLEPTDARRPQLLYEARLYKVLAGRAGIPVVHWCGVEGGVNVMVMDLLGPSLEDLLAICGGRMSLETVLMVADQMITIMEHIHAKNLIHRDIKPENFVIGLGADENRVHAIDFGLAKKFRDVQTLEHIPYKENKSFAGTARYSSTHTHLGIEQSRRDDMEAVGHVLVYLAKGSLPWQGIQAGCKEKHFQQIGERKASTCVQDLCESLPKAFVSYFESCRSLRFDQKPNYFHLRSLFKNALSELRQGSQCDCVFDWMLLKTHDLPQANDDLSEESTRVSETESLPPLVAAVAA
jgi:casein kinase 1